MGTSPTSAAVAGVVFFGAGDFKVTFSAGELVMIPRSKGGLCYGVLDRCTLDKGKAVWSVALGPSVGKNVPERWLGKILAGAAGKRDTLGEPQRAIGRPPLPQVPDGTDQLFPSLSTTMLSPFF